jgi:hypothetical protein
VVAALPVLRIRIVLATQQPSWVIVDRIRQRIITFLISDIIGFEFSKRIAGKAHRAAHQLPFSSSNYSSKFPISGEANAQLHRGVLITGAVSAFIKRKLK